MVEPATSLPTEARPPTPPRESDHKEARLGFSGRFLAKESSSRRSSTSFHPTPDSSAESPNTTSGSTKKKVGWAESADYNDPPALSFDGRGLSHPVQPLPPSAERKPAKSILKAYNGTQEHDYTIVTNTQLLPPHHYANFATMLESIVQFLAGKDKTSKSEAYLTLNSSLKHSENVPDIKAWRANMALLCQCIIQDLNSKLDNGKPDTSMIKNIVVLLASILHRADIAEMLPSDFAVSVVEYGIKAFGDSTLSKEIIRILMLVFAQQNFSAKVMNQDRVVRLIDALTNIENQVKGKSIITQRLQVYRTLLRRSKPYMMTNSAWFKDLFIDMLSSIRDIRMSAITFGLEASLLLGTEAGASRALSELFKMDHSDGLKFGDFYATNLQRMVKSKDESPAVPQIWSIIILFLRSKPLLYDQWTFMKTFTGVINLCFNCSDSFTKFEANYAWNRFVFAVPLSEKTAPNVRKLLYQPLIGQLKTRRSQNARKSVLNSIYTFLYYAFGPNSSPAQLDLYWNEFIKKMRDSLVPLDIHDTTDIAKQDINEACTILTCLFDTKPRPWSETRAMDNLHHNIINVKELPALDSKWLRGRASIVFPTLDLLLEKLFWELGDDSPVTELWGAYMRSISSPSIMEVKVSFDTVSCIASIFGFLHRIWTTGRLKIFSLPLSKGQDAPHTTEAFLKSFEHIISTAIQELGLLPFTEKLLSISQNTFIAVATPSHQPKKIRVEIKCPLHHLVLFFATISPDLEYDQRFLNMVRRILFPFFESRKSSKSKMDFVKDLLNLLPSESTDSCKLIWQILAEFASLAVDIGNQKDTHGHNDEPLGFEYRNTIRILEAGIKYSQQQPLPEWEILFEALVKSATVDAGDAGRALAVIEPLAKIILPLNSNLGISLSLPYLKLLLNRARYPRDRQAFDAAKRRLWGSGIASQRPTTFDPYVALYDCVRKALQISYHSFSKQSIAMSSELMSGVTKLLGECPTPLLLGMLSNVQEGIASWILDADSKLSGGNSLSQALLSLWSAIHTFVPQLLRLHPSTKVLKDLEPLISSGLESKHKTVVNSTLGLWNSGFGISEDTIEYPERLKTALLRLRPIADIKLPFLLETLEEDISADQAQRIEFVDTQDDTTIYPDGSSKQSILRPSLEAKIDPIYARLRQSTPQVILQSRRSTSLKRSRESTPDIRRRKSRKRDITPRLRHDDSQVEFEAVPSSPMTDRVVDSQLLTEKQKETRERQQAEAAVFPDLRPSPRPKNMSARKELDPEPELPLRRSSSQSREIPFAKEPRQSTPSLVPVSDDDQFVVSSPTPTRPTRREINFSDPPSSPPESAVKQRLVINEDIPSSPPESGAEAGNQTTMTMDGSDILHEDNHKVRVDSTSATNEASDLKYKINEFEDPSPSHSNHALSTRKSTEERQYSAPAGDPSPKTDENRLQVAAVTEVLQDVVCREVGDEEASSEDLIESQICCSVNDSQPLGTPTHSRKEFHDNNKTPKTPQYLDAHSTPPSSELPVDEDVFEDAPSSPRLNDAELVEKSRSSPLSDIDESSMLRIMADFDEGSGRTVKQVGLMIQQEESPSHIHPSLNKGDPGVSSCADAHSPMKRNMSQKPVMTQQAQQENKEGQIISSGLQTSSIPSLVPETPGPQRNESTPIFFDDEGQEISLEDSIIVDTSRLKFFQPTVRKRGKKRRYQEFVPESSEVPDGQEMTSRQSTISPKKRSPSKKKARGRHKLSPLATPDFDGGLEFQTSFDTSHIEPDPDSPTGGQHNQSFMPVDADEAMADQEIKATLAAQITSSNQGSNSESLEYGDIWAEFIIQETEQPALSETTEEAQKGERDVDMADVGDFITRKMDGTPESEIIETTIDDSMVEKSSSAPVRQDRNSHEEVVHESASRIAESEPAAPSASPLPDKVAQEEVPAATSLWDKWESSRANILKDFDVAAMSRREVGKWEEWFYDMKRKLFEAEFRGRASVDS